MRFQERLQGFSPNQGNIAHQNQQMRAGAALQPLLSDLQRMAGPQLFFLGNEFEIRGSESFFHRFPLMSHDQEDLFRVHPPDGVQYVPTQRPTRKRVEQFVGPRLEAGALPGGENHHGHIRFPSPHHFTTESLSMVESFSAFVEGAWVRPGPAPAWHRKRSSVMRCLGAFSGAGSQLLETRIGVEGPEVLIPFGVESMGGIQRNGHFQKLQRRLHISRKGMGSR